MELKLLTLAVLKLQLQLSYDWSKENGALETQGCNFIEINFSTLSHPLMGASGTPRIPHHQQLGETKPLPSINRNSPFRHALSINSPLLQTRGV